MSRGFIGRRVRTYCETDAQLRAKRYVQNNQRRFWIVGGFIFTGVTSGYSWLNYYFDLGIVQKLNFSLPEVENMEELVLILTIVDSAIRNSSGHSVWHEFKDGRAINFCVSALEYNGGVDLVKELALKCLAQMCKYDELKKIIISKVDISKVISEATERKNFTQDDIPFYTFIAHYLDDVSVQQIALSVGYLDKLLWLLHSNDATAHSLAIHSISKLSSTAQGCMALANTDAFHTTYQLLYNSSSNQLKTPHRDLIKTKHEAQVTLRNLYLSPALPLLKLKWPDDWDQAERRFKLLGSFDKKWVAVLDFLRYAAISCSVTGLFGILWGCSRHIIRHTMIKGSLKGGALSGLGATSFVMLYKIKCWFDDKYWIPSKFPAVNIAYTALKSITGVTILYYLVPMTPFCVLPAIFGILHHLNQQVVVEENKEKA